MIPTDEIISIANQCNLPLTYVPHDDTFSLHVVGLAAFANLVAARAAAIEREACAKVCDDINEEVEVSDSSQYAIGRGMGLAMAAGAIRARGDQHEQ